MTLGEEVKAGEKQQGGKVKPQTKPAGKVKQAKQGGGHVIKQGAQVIKQGGQVIQQTQQPSKKRKGESAESIPTNNKKLTGKKPAKKPKKPAGPR